MDLKKLAKEAYESKVEAKNVEEQQEQEKMHQKHQVEINEQEEILKEFFGNEMWAEMNPRSEWDSKHGVLTSFRFNSEDIFMQVNGEQLGAIHAPFIGSFHHWFKLKPEDKDKQIQAFLAFLGEIRERIEPRVATVTLTLQFEYACASDQTAQNLAYEAVEKLLKEQELDGEIDFDC